MKTSREKMKNSSIACPGRLVGALGCLPLFRISTPLVHWPQLIMVALLASPAEGSDFSEGLSIAIVGMLIVAVALSLISLFIAAMPRVLGFLETVLPAEEPHPAHRTHPESFIPDDDDVVAAIGFVLHTEFQNQLARERQESQQH